MKQFVTMVLGAGFLEHFEGPITLVDREHRVAWVNPFVVDGEVADPGAIVGRHCYAVYMGRSRPCGDRCAVRRVFRTGKPALVEQTVATPGGTSCHAESRAYPVRGESGEIDYAVQITFDVTERVEQRRRAEQQLEKLEQVLTRLVQAQGRGDAVEPAVKYETRADLTPREEEVLALLARGLSIPGIAAALSISPHTVKTHVAHIYDKLGVRDRARAAVWAGRLGLV